MFVRSLGVLLIALALIVTSVSYAESSGIAVDEALKKPKAERTKAEQKAIDKQRWIDQKERLASEKESAKEQVDEHVDEAKSDYQGKMKKGKEWKKKKASKAKQMKDTGTAKAHDKAMAGKEKAEKTSEHVSEKAHEKVDKAAGEEMKARRDQRKEIMHDAKSNAAAATSQKAKKPWWRFWGSDE